MKTVEEMQSREIDRLLARLEVRRIENEALQEAVYAKDLDLREWQALAVDLGAFAAVRKDKSLNTLDCSIKITAALLATAKDRAALITSFVNDKVARPMIAECEKMWGKQ